MEEGVVGETQSAKLVRKELRRWRKEGKTGEIYKLEKRRHKRLCVEKKKREEEEWSKEVGEVKSESQVWKIVNRERSKRKTINETIDMEDWDNYFRKLLGGGMKDRGRGRRERGGYRGGDR